MFPNYVPQLLFVFVTLGIAIALLLGMPALLALLLATLALCGYSVATLWQRLAGVEADERQLIWRLHMRQLAPVALIGFGLGCAAILLPTRPGFAGLLILALLSAILFGQAIRNVSKQ